MKVELKKIKYLPSLSHETLAFTADVWVEREHVGYAENAGHGGNTSVSARNVSKDKNQYVPHPKFKQWETHLATLPPIHHVTDLTSTPRGEPLGPSGFWEYDEQPDAEQVVDDLMAKWVESYEAQRYQRQLAKAKENKLCFVLEGEDPAVGFREVTWKGLKVLTQKHFDAGVEHLLKKYGTGMFTVLNDRPNA
jgi:hypothetical protein